MKNLVFCTVVSAFLLSAPKLGILKEVVNAITNTKYTYSQVQQLTNTNGDLSNSIANFGNQINQINKTIDDNFALIDKLEQQNKNHNRD